MTRVCIYIYIYMDTHRRGVRDGERVELTERRETPSTHTFAFDPNVC